MSKFYSYEESPLIITLPASGFIGEEFTISCKVVDGKKNASWIVKIPETVTVIENEEQIKEKQNERTRRV